MLAIPMARPFCAESRHRNGKLRTRPTVPLDMSSTPFKPTPAQIASAAGRTIPDVIALDLRVLFCGINPSLYSAAVGHHFARPGNRFWPALHGGGFTPRLYSPFEDQSLVEGGLGLTNIASRASARA